MVAPSYNQVTISVTGSWSLRLTGKLQWDPLLLRAEATESRVVFHDDILCAKLLAHTSQNSSVVEE